MEKANANAAGRWLPPLLLLAAGTGGAAGCFTIRGGPPALLSSYCDGVTFGVPSSSISSFSLPSPQPPFLQQKRQRDRGSPSPVFPPTSSPLLLLRRKLLAASSSSSSSESDDAPPSTRKSKPPKGKAKSKARAALRHVLEDVCQFGEGSAVLAVFRSGAISDIDALCDLTDDEVSTLVRLGVGGGAPAAAATATVAATPTAEQMIETRKIIGLKMWRTHLRRTRGGISPRDDDWLELTSDDFEEFRGMIQDRLDLTAPGAAAGTSRLAIVDAARRARAFVESIMGQEPEPIEGSDGMSVMKNVFMFETGATENIVLRKVTRPFWQACIDAAETPGVQCRVCAVGTPGIGKTTCTPYLIKMLLEQRKTVVYRVRSVSGNRYVYEFMPGPEEGGSVVANVYPQQDWAFTIASLRDPSTFYVVDPGQTEDSCNPATDFRPRVIIVTSPDSRHWGGGEFFKRRGPVNGDFKFYPLWELDELLQARPILGPNLPEDEVKTRYYQVGGVPRHVFASDASFKRTLDLQSLAVSDLTSAQLEKIATLQVQSLSTFDASQPKSALIGFRVPGDDGTFSRFTVDILAPRLVLGLYREFMKTRWRELQLLPSAQNTYLFETYTRLLMGVNSTYAVREAGVGRSDPRRAAAGSKALGGCREILFASDVVCAAREKDLAVFHPADRANRLVDYLYRDRDGRFHAFWATLAATHEAKVDGILKLEEQVGDPSKLSLYYVVPAFLFPEFATELVDPGSPSEGRRGKKNVTCSIYHVSVPDPIANGKTYHS